VRNNIYGYILIRKLGLDPAMPLFATLSRGAILDRSDAHFVDIVHTNAGNKGDKYLGPKSII
jgi:Lipase